MKVITTVVSKVPERFPETNPEPHPPVDIQWYSGDDVAAAMAAMVNAIANAHSDPDWSRTLSARIEF